MEGLIDEEGKSYDKACRRWDDFGNTTHKEADVNPYLDVFRLFNNHAGRNEERDNLDEREPKDDHDIDNLDNDLVRDNAPYHANKEEEQYEEERCEMLGNPHQEPPVCKIKRFEVYNGYLGVGHFGKRQLRLFDRSIDQGIYEPNSCLLKREYSVLKRELVFDFVSFPRDGQESY
ncbi:hypothetical protein Tco_0017528 [Tanacetum coccineum]